MRRSKFIFASAILMPPIFRLAVFASMVKICEISFLDSRGYGICGCRGELSHLSALASCRKP
jgi:hypothetical protein